MFIRHLGHGVGHLKYERQHDDTSLALDNISNADSSDNIDSEDTGLSEEEEGNTMHRMHIDNDSDNQDSVLDTADITSDSKQGSESGGSDSDSYASF